MYYKLPSTRYLKTNIGNMPKVVTLRLRRICDSDMYIEKRNAEYQKYLIARDYKPSKVKKQFSDIRNISREQANRPKIKSNFSTTRNFIREYNPMLPNIKTIFKKYLSVLHSSQEMVQIFSRKYYKCDM